MSIRVHELAKKIGKDNKQTVEILLKYKIEAKSPSSTVDNITAEAIIQEYASPEPAAEAEPAEAVENTEPKAAPKPGLPPGVFVKSAQQVKEEHAQREAAKKQAASAPKAKVVAPPPKAPPAPAQPAARPAQPKVSAPPPAKAAPPPVAKTPPPVKAASPAAPKAAPIPAPAPSPAPAPKPAAAAPAAPSTPPKPAVEAPKEDVAPGELRKLQIKPPIVVRDFATRMDMKPFKLISELMEMGIFASMNQTIDEETASKIAEVHGFELEIRHRGEGTVTKDSQKKAKRAKNVDEDPSQLEERPPVVCILGHVDHGKTTLLDTIRKANVASGEFGGITQHVGAYQVTHSDKKITFIDTPGHAAFSAMRERGADITDVAILVVAADDGFKPQSDEALKFAKRSQSAIMVAINKIDTKGADIDNVKKQMQDKGIPAEDWGGETIAVPISALKGENIDQLLDMVLLQAEIMELKANPKASPEGVIVESQMEQGRGPTATAIIEKGTLKVGDALITGSISCKVRAMLDDQGKNLKSAPPATPVKIVGWSDVPISGSRFEKVKNDKEAKKLAEENRVEELKEQQQTQSTAKSGLDALFSAIESTQKPNINCIIKADVHGSLEAIKNALGEINTDKVDLNIIADGVGPVSKKDITRASTSNACIISFNSGLETGAMGVAKHEGVKIYPSTIIYELIDTVRDLMADQLEPELRETHLGNAEVKATFAVSKGVVAGCMVTEGKIVREKSARLLRNGEIIADSKVNTLKRFKDDVNEVKTGFECGIRLLDFNDYQEGDIIECYDIEKIKPSL